MKRIRHENKVRWSSQFRNVEGVTGDEVAICYSAFHQPMPRDFQQIRVNINRRNVPGNLCYLKGEPTIA